jgi:predicted nucleotidyltransferase
MILAKEYITKVITDFFKDKPVKKVWLFGSYARGEADEASDVDVLIDIEKNKKVGLQYFLWHEQLAEILQKKVDIVSSGWENKYIKPFIDKDKYIIYEK